MAPRCCSWSCLFATFSVIVAALGILIAYLQQGNLDLVSLLVAHGTKLVIRDVYPPASDLHDLSSFRKMFVRLVQQGACSNDPMLCEVEIPFIDNTNASLLPIFTIKVKEEHRNTNANQRFSRIFDSHIVAEKHDHPIDIRIYEPVRKVSEVLGVTLWFHGGGFVIGTHLDDFKCTLLANITNTVVISVNYALAPEKPYPHGRVDCELTLAWLESFTAASTSASASSSPSSMFDHIDVDLSNVYLIGESAGGHHAAACIMNYNGSFKANVKGLVLIYPEIDHTEELTESESNLSHFNGFFTTLQNSWFWRLYLGRDKKEHELYEIAQNDPLINLLNANEDMLTSVKHMKVLIILAKHDILYSEGVAFAEMLRSRGGEEMNVETKIYEAIHGFWGEFTFPSTKHSLEAIRNFYEQ